MEEDTCDSPSSSRSSSDTEVYSPTLKDSEATKKRHTLNKQQKQALLIVKAEAQKRQAYKYLKKHCGAQTAGGMCTHEVTCVQL